MFVHCIKRPLKNAVNDKLMYHYHYKYCRHRLTVSLTEYSGLQSTTVVPRHFH